MTQLCTNNYGFFTLWKAFKQMLSDDSRIAYFFKDENIHRYLLFPIANPIFFLFVNE